MNSRRILIQCIFSCVIACSIKGQAASISWIAQSPNNDMNDSANWSGGSVPGNSDIAIFNSNTPSVATNPVENSVPFSVSTFQFPSSASVFNFQFNNNALNFYGNGITGSNKNPTITVTNADNSSFPGDLISFLGVTGTSGNSTMISSNSATLGSSSTGSIGSFNSNLHSVGPFTIASGGSITATNTGHDAAISTGNNGVVNTGESQLRFQDSFTGSNDVTIFVSNSGTFTGNNSTQGDAVAIINGSQFNSTGAVSIGNNFSCTLQNTANDSSSGVGLSNVGQLNQAQMILSNTATIGNNSTITISNEAINSSQTTTYPDFIGYLNDQQFYVGDTFIAGDNLNLTVSNTGADTSSGHGGHNLAVINSNSGTTGNQILFNQNATVGDHAVITGTNSGTYSGTNTSIGSNVASMNLGQIVIGYAPPQTPPAMPYPGTYHFSAGDYFTLTASNSGTDSAVGLGSDNVANIADQITIANSALLGSYAQISITNSGNYSGDASTSYGTVGSVGASQLNCESTFSAGDHFTLIVNNSGTNTGTGVGGYFIGALTTGQQLSFGDNFTLGNNASITISNSGSNSSNTTNGNTVGSLNGYGKQLSAQSLFQVGNDFTLTITNSGFDDSTGPGGNYVGYMNNNIHDHSASQFHLASGGTLGDRASITLSNSGTFAGNNTTTTNNIGTLEGQQFYSVSDFQSGNTFVLTASNTGTDNGLGTTTNSIGLIGETQVQFDGEFNTVPKNGLQMTITNAGTNNGNDAQNYIGYVVHEQLYMGTPSTTFNAGSNAVIKVSNTGTNSGSNASPGFVGAVDSQIKLNNNFSATTGLQMTITNEGNNSGSSTNNYVGYVAGTQLWSENPGATFDVGSHATIQVTNTGSGLGALVGYVGSQIRFDSDFVASDNLIVTATNNGIVANDQILFDGGFNPGSSATISAINNAPGGPIVGVRFSSPSSATGGDVLINLVNSDLNIDNAVPNFTIAGLNGDSASTVTPNTTTNLIIGLTGSSVSSATFNGIIDDTSVTPGLTLTKSGALTQTLSGFNLYTGLTTIEQGILSINGSVIGDVRVTSGGTLKGTGTIGGLTTIEAGGTLYPGNSVGTINLTTLTLNSGAITAIEIDPSASSRILVSGSAALDGTLQIVPDIGAYPHEGNYFIVNASPLSGHFSSVSSVPGYTFNLSYIGNDIYLSYLLAIPTEGLSGNSLIVADYLNANAPPSVAFGYLAALSGETLNLALESVSPSRNAFATYISGMTAFTLSDLVSIHMDGLRFARKSPSEDQFLSALIADSSDSFALPVKGEKSKNSLAGWVTGFGEFAHQEASSQNPSMYYISGGALVGLDYYGENRDVVGASFGYAHTHYSESRHSGYGNINYYVASLYGNAYMGDFYLSPAIWGIYNQTNNTRTISFPGYSENALADIDAWQFVPHLEAGYDIRFSWGNIIPFTSADWAITWQREYTEHGASPFNAKQQANNSSIVRSETGLKFCEKWRYDWGAFFLKEKISYIFNKPFGTGTVNTAFIGTPGSITLTAVNQNLNLASLGLNFLVALEKERPVRFDFGYEGEFGSNYWSNELMLTISRIF